MVKPRDGDGDGGGIEDSVLSFPRHASAVAVAPLYTALARDGRLAFDHASAVRESPNT